MTDEKRTLIETFLPVEDISEEAKSEKAGRSHNFDINPAQLENIIKGKHAKNYN